MHQQAVARKVICNYQSNGIYRKIGYKNAKIPLALSKVPSYTLDIKGRRIVMDYYKLKYLEFNKRFFLNRLPTNVRIAIRAYSARKGCIHIHGKNATPYYAEIFLGKTLKESEQLLTLKHEMVHLYCHIRDKEIKHSPYFWKLLKVIGGEPNLNYKTAKIIFGEERWEKRGEYLVEEQKKQGEVRTMAEEKAKKVSGTAKLVDMLEKGAYTVAELAEGCGISLNTVKVQLSYHLKQKGYVIAKDGDKYTITGKGEPLPQKPKVKKEKPADGTAE